MRSISVTLIAAIFFGVVVWIFVAALDREARAVNYEAPDNLESKYDLGCIGSDNVERKYTPTDLYRAMSKCVESGMYKEGVFLFAVAGVYGRFDAFRVVDKTARQAVIVARMEAIDTLDEEKIAKFQENLKATLGKPEGVADICKKIIKIGPPDYYPRYMVQHGMDAFVTNDKKEELIKDFDAKAAWKKALGIYLHCQDVESQ